MRLVEINCTSEDQDEECAIKKEENE